MKSFLILIFLLGLLGQNKQFGQDNEPKQVIKMSYEEWSRGQND